MATSPQLGRICNIMQSVSDDQWFDQVAVCELPYNPISSETEGGIGGTYDFSPFTMSIQYLRVCLYMSLWRHT